MRQSECTLAIEEKNENEVEKINVALRADWRTRTQPILKRLSMRESNYERTTRDLSVGSRIWSKVEANSKTGDTQKAAPGAREGSIGGLRYIDEKVAQMVPKRMKRSLKWRRLVETCTVGAAFQRCFGCGEFN